MIKILYHGSDREIKHPAFGVGKKDNDYGSGFYTTEDIQKAAEWAAANGKAGIAYCNKYQIDFSDLNVIYLDNYGTLAWISEVIANRGTDNVLNEEIGNILVGKYKINTENADIIVGYRADDSYIKVVDAFLENMMTIDEVDRMFKKGHLGTQTFIKSKKAFDSLTFIDSKKIDSNDYPNESDRIARREFSQFINSRNRAIIIEGFSVNSVGLTVRDAIKNNLKFENGFYHK